MEFERGGRVPYSEEEGEEEEEEEEDDDDDDDDEDNPHLEIIRSIISLIFIVISLLIVS